VLWRYSSVLPVCRCSRSTSIKLMSLSARCRWYASCVASGQADEIYYYNDGSEASRTTVGRQRKAILTGTTAASGDVWEGGAPLTNRIRDTGSVVSSPSWVRGAIARFVSHCRSPIRLPQQKPPDIPRQKPYLPRVVRQLSPYPKLSRSIQVVHLIWSIMHSGEYDWTDGLNAERAECRPFCVRDHVFNRVLLQIEVDNFDSYFHICTLCNV